MYGTIFMLGVISAVGWSTPLDAGGCKIIPFETSIFKNSFLLENRLMCRTAKNEVPTADFCLHLYKCPLDFERERECTAVCRRDGTWDYTYPSCEDMVPLADAILKAIENGKDDDEIVSILSDTKQARKRRWAVLVKPPVTEENKPSTVAPTEDPSKDAEPVPKHEPKTMKAGSMKKLEDMCLTRMCPLLRKGNSCKILVLNMNDHVLQTTICHICVKKFCKTSINLFGSGV